jgi:hypothetical protein
MTDTITRPPNLTSSQAISQHEVIVRQYDIIVELREAAKHLSAVYDSIWCKLSDGEVQLVREAWQRMDAAAAKADSYLK